jgi:hypothetical protein
MKDLLSLSDAWPEMKTSEFLQQVIYKAPFGRDELPRKHYRDFIKRHKPLYDKVLDGINTTTGAYVQKLVVYEWITIKTLQRLAQMCPNLTTIDFTGIVEPIDFTRYKHYGTGCHHGLHGKPMLDIPAHEIRKYEDEDVEWNSSLDLSDKRKSQIGREMARCHACSDRFQWPLVLKYCPELFANLTRIGLNYSGARAEEHQGSISGRRQLPTLLRLATRLQELHLFCSEGPGMPDQRATQVECERFQSAILENASTELQVLCLYTMYPLMPNLSDFLLPLEENLPNLRTVALTLHDDLHHHNCAPSTYIGETTTPLEYIIALRQAISRGWKIEVVDSGQDLGCTMNASRYFSLTNPDSIEHLRWFLGSGINWTPVFPWENYMYIQPLRRINANRDPHTPNIETDFPAIRNLFSEFSSSGQPVRLLLEPPGYEDGFFSWQMDNIIERPGTPRFLGNSREFITALPWRLDTIGDLVDDLRIMWHWTHVFGLAAHLDDPGTCTPEKADYLVKAHLKRTRGPVEKRLKYEAERMAPFFKKLKIWLPNLKRLAMVIPGPLYPDHDSDFITRVLPGEGWTVKHYGTGTGDEHSDVLKPCLNEGDQLGADTGYGTDDEEEETDEELNRRRKISGRQVWDMMDKVEEERLPMLQRVFTRGMEEGRSAPVGDWYRTPRGVGLDCFDVTAMEGRRCFRYLWGEPVSRSEVGGGVE